MVAANQGPHSHERFLRPLLDTYPRLYVDTSYLLVARLLEESCARYGPGRLLFGTAFPDNCAGGALLTLACAELDEPSRQAVAGGNLRRLLEEARL
jgi:hypothetical protein